MNHECKNESRIVRSESDVQKIFDKVDALSSKIMIIVGLGIALQFFVSIGVFKPVISALVAPVEQSIIMATYP